MILIKSAWSPRTIMISQKDYVRIYPDCGTPRRIDLLFTRVAGCLLLDEPIANFIIGKYDGLEIDNPAEAPSTLSPEPEPEPEVEIEMLKQEPEPMAKPEPLIDPDDYTPQNIVSKEEVPTISNPPKKGSKKK